jgi:hypothetical protein
LACRQKRSCPALAECRGNLLFRAIILDSEGNRVALHSD